MKIKLLSQLTISRIAAGEVIVSPAFAIKELVENSIDAGATEISILFHRYGCNLISVTDNGSGMSIDDLTLAVDRHTTSKLDEKDIFDIKQFGFRGEALPSIGSVSRMNITSRLLGSDDAWSIDIIGGDKSSLYPASLPYGTKIEVRDLFFATPARLKFLKSEKVELQNIIDIVSKLALSNPQIGFILSSENKIMISTKAQNPDNKNTQLNRVREIIGTQFADNSVYAEEQNANITIKGFIGLPTYNKATASDQYFFVNNRPVKDKILYIAAKLAYQDFLANDRFPVIAIFLELPTHEVDVNVHPTKSEVRFRDTNSIRSIVTNFIKTALVKISNKSSSSIAEQAIAQINKNNIPKFYQTNIIPDNYNLKENKQNSFIYSKPQLQQNFLIDKTHAKDYASEINSQNIEYRQCHLGTARCQLHDTYIVSQTETSIIITDQHAAHERLVYEKLKESHKNNNVIRQRLLIPEIIDLDEKRVNNLIDIKGELSNFGLIIEQFGVSNIIVNEIPAIIGDTSIKELINDLADELLEFEENFAVNKLIKHILETFACHHSIRAGRKLNISEMNSMLREMASTPNTGQCNHGRPTYIELKLTDIEKLFGR